MNSSELLKNARDLIRYADPATGGRWPRASALLARQALEGALDDYWRAVAPGVERTSARAQFLCLRQFTDEETAERAYFAWTALSRACHHHVYELAPTAEELARWMEDVERVVNAMDNHCQALVPLPHRLVPGADQ